MSGVLIVILLLAAVFVAASVALGRATYEVDSASDTEYLELEGHWIRYHVLGGGPPVVLVHGWLSSGRIWDRLADRLAQRFTVYTLDLSGFGESDKPISGYGVRYGSRLLYAFCAHFGLTRAAVVGHDVGGAMAVKLAADHPEVVGRLVLVAAPADEDQIDLPTGLWLATLSVVGPVFYTLGRYVRFMRRLWMRPFVSDRYDLTDEAVEDVGRSTPAAAAKTLDVMQREISRGRLVRQAGIIKVPVLLVAGEEDQIVDPQALGDWDRVFPSAEVALIDGVGHLPMLESTREFNAHVLAFLTGDSRYLEGLDEPEEAEELDEEDISAQPEETGEETPPIVYREDEETPPIDYREQDASVSPPGPEAEPEAGPETEPGGVPHDEETVDFTREGFAQRNDLDEDAPRDGGERRGAGERDPAAESDDDEEWAPRKPEDLFQWPEAWKEFRPRERFDPGREPEEPGEEPGEEPREEPREEREEGPEEGPKRS